MKGCISVAQVRRQYTVLLYTADAPVPHHLPQSCKFSDETDRLQCHVMICAKTEMCLLHRADAVVPMVLIAPKHSG
jgi:hypothetical protein